jgi:NAD(P)-dependent dehydrogenase (short-subunit alcohol dehydrogenase family)
MSKVWLITGASRGFGRTFTKAVLEAGDRVVATARNPEQLVELEDRFFDAQLAGTAGDPLVATAGNVV